PARAAPRRRALPHTARSPRPTQLSLPRLAVDGAHETAARLTERLTVAGDHVAAQHGHLDRTTQATAVPWTLRLLRVQPGAIDGCRRLGIDQCEVRIPARLDGALAGMQPVQPRGAFGQHPGQTLQRDL